MKFGVREVTDIVFRTKQANQKVGSRTYAEKYPVLYIDSAKMTSLENAVSTVYAQGGRGNPRLLAWDGDRTATFKFDDSLVTNDGLAILTGSEGNKQINKFRQQYASKTTVAFAGGSESFIAAATLSMPVGATLHTGLSAAVITLDTSGDVLNVYSTGGQVSIQGITVTQALNKDTNYILDFYAETITNQLQIEAGKFAGYYYIEANTLFRDSQGVDHPAQISIPKGKIKSNFTLTMSPTGDPSTFSFEVDALPDYTYSVTDKKVLYTLDIAALEISSDNIV